MSGTSMSTPHLAGVVTLLLEANPGLDTNGLKTALYANADRVTTCYQCAYYLFGTCFSQRTVTCNSGITGAGVVNAYTSYLQVADGRTCTDDCRLLDDACNTGYCDTSSGTCKKVPRPDTTSCDDGNACTASDVCHSGVCTGTPVTCGLSDGCCLTTCGTDPDCSSSTRCWSGQYKYLVGDLNQAQKFCKCASGVHDALSYTPSLVKKANAYQYLDTGDTTNWAAVRTSTAYPARYVLCGDGTLYSTNVDYYQ
jgi:Subtilase family.